MRAKGSANLARLLNEYVTSAKQGSAPPPEVLLARCLEHEREELRIMLIGAEALLEDGWVYHVSPKTVEGTISAIHRVRYRKQRVREAEARLGALPDFSGSDLIEPLSAVLEFPPELVEQARAAQLQTQGSPSRATTVWNRARGALGAQSRRLLDRQREAVLERGMDEEASRLLERYDLCRAPVDLEKLARQLGIVVRDVLLDEGVDGCLLADDDCGVILLNRRIENSRRRRFTLAHEIAHFIRHRKHRFFRDKLSELGVDADKQEEKEANILAAMLLMPKELIPPEYAQDRPTLAHADDLVARFEVSLLAVLRRMVRMSHSACALVALQEGQIRWSVESDYFDYFIPAHRSPHPDTAVGILMRDKSADRAVMEHRMVVPLSAWVATEPREGDEEEEQQLAEESRCFPGGYTYTILTAL
jgi:Zn-dependent peptidase ImmA (M78 family)